ncbi:MAG: hypothetical protein AAF798_07305 [Bacteroidota bacterium]
MRLYIILLCFLFAYSWQAFGQTQSSSLYAAYGLGVPQQTHFGAIEALAGTGIGLQLPYNLNTKNPASLNSLAAPFTMFFNLGLNTKLTQTTDQTQESMRLGGGLTNLDMWFRIKRNWSLLIGVSPFTEADYSIFRREFFPQDGSNYTVLYEGEGGLTQARLSQAWTLFDRLHLGLTGYLYFGSITRSENVFGINSSGDFTVETNTAFADVNFELGVQYVIPVGESKYTIGSTFRPQANLASDQDYTLTTALESLEGELARTETYYLPMRLGFGGAFQSKKWLFAVDATYEEWSSANGNQERLVTYKDVLALSAGAEYALFKRQSDYAIQATRIRAGVGVRNSYLELDEQDFLVWQFTLGVGIPFSRAQNLLNISYQYNRQGDISNSLVRDITHTIAFSFDLRDIWFKKRRFQ